MTQLLGLSGAQIAKLVGTKEPRTVRKWISGEAPIAYSVWRLLLLEAGLAVPDVGEPDVEGWLERAREDLGKVAGNAAWTSQPPSEPGW